MKKLYIGDNLEIKINSVVKEVAINMTTDTGSRNISILKDSQGKLWINLAGGEKEVAFIPLNGECLSLNSRGEISASHRAFNIDIIDGSIRLTNNGVIGAEVSALPQIRPDSAVKWSVHEVLDSLKRLRHAKEQGPFWRAQKQLKEALQSLGRCQGEADIIAELLDDIFPGPVQQVAENALAEIKMRTKKIEEEIRRV